MAEVVYDYICSIAELVDKLCIENIKISHGHHALEDEHKGEGDAERIAELEYMVRLSCEQRVRLKNELNRRLAEALKRGSINCSKEARTYDA